jgi:glycosyltransferase involved in cell wall biosynthesis/protein-tyrosine-phosphatase
MMPATELWPARPVDVTETRSVIRVCHVMSADLWAGAEVQVGTIASYLVRQPEIQMTAVLLNDGRLARELRILGIEVAVIDERRHSSAAILAFLVRFLRAHRIDILHTHRYKDTVLGTLAAKLAGVSKVVRTVHGLAEPMRGWDRLKFRTYNALDKAALWCFADRIIAVSEDLAQSLRESGYRRSAVIPIHNGIDLCQVRIAKDAGEVRRQLDIPPSALLIGTVGRLAPVKAQVDLLRAAQRILRAEPDARFLIAGEGPLRGDLLATAAQLGVDRACRFVGDRHDVLDLIGAMDIFVLPSLHEGIPMAVLEAMALGTPVVATAVGGVPEIVADRVSGLLVAPRDDRALADACVSLARNRSWAQALAAAGRRAVANRFSHDASGHALIETYRSLLPAPSRDAVTGGVDLSAPALAWELVRGLARISHRRMSRAMATTVERMRMSRIRRRPDALAAALRSATGILIVCHGNIIRSAYAARLVRQALGDGSRIRVASAGLEAIAGKPSHPTARQVAAERSVDLSTHLASPIDPETVAASDVIFVMEVPQLLDMRRRFPEARGKTFLLTCLAREAALEISDPVDGDESRFEACFDHISRAVQPILGALGAAAPTR